MIHPSPDRIRQLTDRWTGQDGRLQRIAESMLAGEDWTAHLRGLPYVDEIPPREGEAYGRDLRGADLRTALHPRIDVTRATERDAALVAALTLEGLQQQHAPRRRLSRSPRTRSRPRESSWRCGRAIASCSRASPGAWSGSSGGPCTGSSPN